MRTVDLLRQQLDRVLVRNVLYHQRRARVLVYTPCVDLVVLRIQLPQPLAVVVVVEVGREVGGRSKGTVHLPRRQPDLTLPLLELPLTPNLLTGLDSALLGLLPRATDTLRFDLLQDLIRHLPGHIRRPRLALRVLLFGRELLGVFSKGLRCEF